MFSLKGQFKKMSPFGELSPYKHTLSLSPRLQKYLKYKGCEKNKCLHMLPTQNTHFVVFSQT